MNNSNEILSTNAVNNSPLPEGVNTLSQEIDEINRQVNIESNRYMKYGTVPTFYVPKRAWLRPNKYESKSIKDRIQNASSTDEIKSILDIGKAYKNASASTVRRWERLAEQKLREFGV